MALFRIGASNDNAIFVRGDGVYLRPPEMHDFEQWAALRHLSRTFLTPWEPTWPPDDLTKSSFRRRIKRHAGEIENDDAYPFLLFRESDDALLGGLTFGQIKRGVAQAATLGYWMGQPFAGQGFMARAVRAATGFAFATLRLHRIEAGVPAAKRGFDPPAHPHQLPPGRIGARLPAHQRAVAGPPALRVARIRSDLFTPATPGSAVTSSMRMLAPASAKLYRCRVPPPAAREKTLPPACLAPRAARPE